MPLPSLAQTQCVGVSSLSEWLGPCRARPKRPLCSPSSCARPQVEILEGRTECVLSNLRGATRYTFAVRARMAEPSFSGFWSAWSEPASLLTASGETQVGV